MRQVEKARPGLGGEGRAVSAAAVVSSQSNSTTPSRCPAVLIHRRFGSDPQRAASAIARLLITPRPALQPEKAPTPDHPDRRAAG